jgi:hypothetical protein
MEPVTIESGELILPVRLPFREHELLQLPVRADQQQRGSSLESNPALDAEGSLADVKTTPDSVAPGEVTQLLNDARPSEIVCIQANRQPLLPAQHDLSAG